MYGQGGGEVSTIVTGATATTVGVAVLPNTGGNDILLILSLFSIVAGWIIIGSFTLTRLMSLRYRVKR
jgi:uncharacterized membrane protein HdeD (DUF308 family)